jgi:predicted nuclease of predicted toxin-antitoxin system
VKIRFHFDEHVPASVAAALRRRGIDLTTTGEAELLGATDQEQLSFALATRRVFVTHDADFLRLHQQGAAHAGIAFCAQGSLSVAQLIRSLLLVHDLLVAEEIAGHVEFL